jgi:hypothetical protein
MREVLLDEKLCSFKFLDFEDLIKPNKITTFHKDKQRHCFHSHTQSRFDLESLALCLKESNGCRREE